MSANESPGLDTGHEEKTIGEESPELRPASSTFLDGGEDILALQDLDPALNMKMHLVNNVSC